MRMREKLTSNTFLVIWTPGKPHNIADSLSRAPVMAHVSYRDIEHCLRLFDASPTLLDASRDGRYQDKIRLTAWRSTSRQDGYSPVQLFFSRRQLQGLPLLDCHLLERTLAQDLGDKEAKRLHNNTNKQSKNMDEL